MVDISIIIPFKDQLKQLNNCIQGILNQEIALSFEIIILDSSESSMQNEIEQLSSKINYFRILPNSFNHGITRNQGVNFAKGDVLVFTVQDSIPVDRFWLANLIKPLIDNNLDAICGKQISNPNENTNPIWWFRPIDKPTIRYVEIDSTEFCKLSSEDKLKYTVWDNVNAAYSKKSLLNIPFRNMMFGEDAQWAVDALGSDFRLAYTSFSVVYHDHPFDFDFAIKRTLAEYYTRKTTIDLDPIMPQFKLITLLKWIYLLSRITKNPIKTIYWSFIGVQQFRAVKCAYNYWINRGFTEVEEFLILNVPMSRK